MPARLVERRTGRRQEHRVDVLRLQPAAFVGRHVGSKLLPAREPHRVERRFDGRAESATRLRVQLGRKRHGRKPRGAPAKHREPFPLELGFRALVGALPYELDALRVGIQQVVHHSRAMGGCHGIKLRASLSAPVPVAPAPLPNMPASFGISNDSSKMKTARSNA